MKPSPTLHKALGRVELEERRDADEGEKDKAGICPSGSPFERGESNKEDPLTFRLALNEG